MRATLQTLPRTPSMRCSSFPRSKSAGAIRVTRVGGYSQFHRPEFKQMVNDWPLRRPAPQLQVPLVARPRNQDTCRKRSSDSDDLFVCTVAPSIAAKLPRNSIWSACPPSSGVSTMASHEAAQRFGGLRPALRLLEGPTSGAFTAARPSREAPIRSLQAARCSSTPPRRSAC